MNCAECGSRISWHIKNSPRIFFWKNWEKPRKKKLRVAGLPSWISKRYGKVEVKVKCSRYRPGVAQRVGRGIALLFHDRGTRRGWVVSSTPRPYFTPGKDPVPIVQEAGWAPGPVCGKAEVTLRSVWRSWGINPPILNLGIRWKWVPGALSCAK